MLVGASSSRPARRNILDSLAPPPVDEVVEPAVVYEAVAPAVFGR